MRYLRVPRELAAACSVFAAHGSQRGGRLFSVGSNETWPVLHSFLHGACRDRAPTIRVRIISHEGIILVQSASRLVSLYF